MLLLLSSLTRVLHFGIEYIPHIMESDWYQLPLPMSFKVTALTQGKPWCQWSNYENVGKYIKLIYSELQQNGNQTNQTVTECIIWDILYLNIVVVLENEQVFWPARFPWRRLFLTIWIV